MLVLVHTQKKKKKKIIIIIIIIMIIINGISIKYAYLELVKL